MKVLVSELKEWFYSEWEKNWFVQEVDDDFSFDEWLENTKETHITTKQLNDMIFLWNDSNNDERAASKDFLQWKSKSDYEFIKVPKFLINTVKRIIDNYEKDKK